MIEDGDRLSRNVNRAEHTGLSLLPKERWFTGHLHTLTGALRGLRASRGVSAIAILTMAVAIAANTAVFSVDDHEFVLHSGIDARSGVAGSRSRFNNPQRNVSSPSISIPRYEELRAEAQSFSSIGLSWIIARFTLTGNDAPREPLTGLRVSASFFSTLGVMPAFGRNFTEAEDVPNGRSVCVISSELWHTQFGGRQSRRRDDRT